VTRSVPQQRVAGGPLARWWPVVLPGLAAVIVFRGALGLYFAQDDFRGLAVAAGVYPAHDALWRWLSVQGFMNLFHPMFGAHPWPYHAISLVLHALNAGLLFVLLARVFRPPAALVAASFFAVHPAHFTALYWISARADLMATMFALITVLLALRSGRERWLALPVFVLSLLSKESTLLLPVAILGLRAWRAEPGVTTTDASETRFRALRDPVVWGLLAIALAGGLYLLVPRDVGIDVGLDANAAYGFDFGTSLIRNLLTYAGWTVDLVMLEPGLRFVDAQNPGLFLLGGAVLVLAFAASRVTALARRGWLAGLAAYLLMLAPVLPLRNHTYHYYLYAPLAAASLCVGALTDWIIEWITRPSRTRVSAGKRGATRAKQPTPHTGTAFVWTIALACVAAIAWNGARLTHLMEYRPSSAYPGMRGDPIVDRARIAQQTIASLAAADLPDHAELAFVLRERLALLARIARGSGEAPPPADLLYPESNMQSAILDGLAVRALVPGVARVSFEPPPGEVPSTFRYVVYAPTGEANVYAPAALDSLLRSDWVKQW
jgi:Dolichyl-phosphate-mannose-protein mannosyltransferase